MCVSWFVAVLVGTIGWSDICDYSNSLPYRLVFFWRILGQVCSLIVSIPDLCHLSYFVMIIQDGMCTYIIDLGTSAISTFG